MENVHTGDVKSTCLDQSKATPCRKVEDTSRGRRRTPAPTLALWLSDNLLTRFSRITSTGRNVIPQIDGLRFIAIGAVIAYHIRGICLHHFGFRPENPPPDLVARAFAAGHFGVQLFFAISGFILSLPFARQYLLGERPLSLRQYYTRRVTRIEPPYVIHLVFLLLLCFFVYRRLPAHPQLWHNPQWVSFSAAHLAASLFYSNGFIFGVHPYPNNVLWSLEVEVQFYILAPFLARLFLISSAAVRRSLLTVGILVFSIAGWDGQSYRVWASLLGNLQYFLIGFLVTDFYLSGCLNSENRRWVWDLALILAAAAVVWTQDMNLVVVLLPCAILLGCLAAFRGILWAPFLGNPWVMTIGGMCYTIYLYHSVLISLAVRVTRELRTGFLWLDLLIQLVLIGTTIILICAVLFALFERPFMRRDWPARVWKWIRF